MHADIYINAFTKILTANTRKSLLLWIFQKEVSSDGHLVALRRNFLKDDLFDACESMVPGLELIKLYSESEDKDLAIKLSSLLNHLSGFFNTTEQIGNSGYIKWQDPFYN